MAPSRLSQSFGSRHEVGSQPPAARVPCHPQDLHQQPAIRRGPNERANDVGSVTRNQNERLTVVQWHVLAQRFEELALYLCGDRATRVRLKLDLYIRWFRQVRYSP